MNGNIKIKGQLKLYMQWPVIMVLLLLLIDLCIFRISIKGGVIATCFIAVYLAIAVFQYHNSRADILNELISFATQYGQVQKSLLRDFIVPYALVDGRGRILWMNEAFSQLSQKPVKYHRSITSIFQEITIERLPKDESSEVLFQFENRDYRASMRKISIEAMLEDSGLIESDADNFLTAIYIFDETDVNRYKKERDEEKLVTGLLYLDNYEEALNSVEEVRRSLLVALIERKLNTTNFKVMPDNSVQLFDYIDDKELVGKTLFENEVAVTNLSNEGGTLEDYFVSMVGGIDNV